MKPTIVIATIALLAGGAGTAAQASDHERRHDHDRTPSADKTQRPDRGMQVVGNPAQAGEPGHGWRYFTDPAARRAVVISPQGDYYYSRGRGLDWVTRAAA
ncbi:MAG: hypothetical protein AMXMBFR66_20090 [Pseudomonadota bacterium]|nr:hypothetical protein [Rubrivivax sp.]NLZ41665.1 hypothetical protein [Comamonadaceae bacterium]